jgi:hypothetical protein
VDSRKEPLPALGPALQALAGESRRGLGDHPSPERLAAYHEGALPPGEEERLRDHLALCPDCAQLLLDLAGFPELETPAGARGLTDGEVDAAWQTMRSRLGSGGEERPPAPALRRLPQPLPISPMAPISPISPISQVSPAAAISSTAPSSRSVWALAASWLVVAGLSFWVVELRRENARLEEPAVNAVVSDLTANGDSTRGGGESRELQTLLAGSRLLLILNAPDLPAHAGYEAEIREDRETGSVFWTGRNLHPSLEKNFTLDLGPDFLRPGKYQVRLYGVDAGKRQKLADYPLRISAP